MQKSHDEIRGYLAEVRAVVTAGNYRIETNGKRQANLALYREYVIDEEKSKEILMDLAAGDFCEALRNEHKGYEREQLYVFGKEVRLLQRFGTEEETVALYIKLNKLGSRFLVVVSFHKQEYPLTYAFK